MAIGCFSRVSYQLASPAGNTPLPYKGNLVEHMKNVFFRPAARFRAGPAVQTSAPLAPADALRLRGHAPRGSRSPSPRGPRSALSKLKKCGQFRGAAQGPCPTPAALCAQDIFFKNRSSHAQKIPAVRPPEIMRGKNPPTP